MMALPLSASWKPTLLLRRRLSNEDWPANGHDDQMNMLAVMLGGEDQLRIFLFNKVHQSERLCPACRTRYTIFFFSEGEGETRAEQEQFLSGICSSRCFVRLNSPNGYDRQEWMGRAADQAFVEVGSDGRFTAVHRVGDQVHHFTNRD